MKQVILLFSLILISLFGFSQTFPDWTTGTFNNCRFHFYDGGGGGGTPILDIIRTSSSGWSYFNLGSNQTYIGSNTVGEFRYYTGVSWWPTFYSNGVERMKILTSGQHNWNGYGSGIYTGTVAKYIAVDLSGNLIEASGTGGASNASGATYTATTSNLVNLSAYPITNVVVASYSKVDKIVTLQVTCQVASPATNTATSIDISLPAGLPFANFPNAPVVITNTGGTDVNTLGYAAYQTSTTVRVRWKSGTNTASTNMAFTIQYPTP